MRKTAADDEKMEHFVHAEPPRSRNDAVKREKNNAEGVQYAADK